MRSRILTLTSLLIVSSAVFAAQPAKKTVSARGFLAAKIRTLGTVTNNCFRALIPSAGELLASAAWETGVELIKGGAVEVPSAAWTVGLSGLETGDKFLRGHHRYVEEKKGKELVRVYQSDDPEKFEALSTVANKNNPFHAFEPKPVKRDWMRLVGFFTHYFCKNFVGTLCNNYIDSKLSSWNTLSPFWSLVVAGARHGIVTSVLDSAVFKPSINFAIYDVPKMGFVPALRDRWQWAKTPASLQKQQAASI